MPDTTGWRILRLSPPNDPGPAPGKRPLDEDWPNLPPPSDVDVDGWLADGFNIGVATGYGFVVVDIDLPEIPAEFPATLTARTGRPGGGWHLYYLLPPGADPIRNSASKLGQHIDVRGTGGQVVMPPSRHKSGERYTWFRDVPMAVLPEWILAACSASGKWIEVDWKAADRPRRDWGRVALERECAKLAGTAHGARNDQLFRSAAALVEIVNGGHLGQEEVSAGLRAAAAACGLPDDETERTIAQAVKKVGTKARVPKERPRPAPLRPAEPVPDHLPTAAALATVLVPGAHVTDTEEYVEVTPAEFSTTILACQPAHTLFRRGGIAGVVRGGAFVPLSASGLRIALGAKPYKWVRPKPTQKDPTPRPVKVYVPVTKEHAELVQARAADHPNVGDIRLVTYAPTFLPGDDMPMSQPGWNHTGVYQAGLWTGETGGCLRDLLIDFPWKTEADRQNFIGLLITVIVRAALSGNVPMHLILSTVERTGKTKLVDEIIGILFLNGPVPAMQFAGSDEERDKRILAVLMLGLPVVHLDNLGEWFDSAAMASTITAEVYSGRVLGQSAMANVPNVAVWIGTGNNVSMSGEMAKRTVPIHLLPADADPHLRTQFVHSDLREYVREHRDAILGTLIAMVRAWIDAGRPPSPLRVGGFEAWSRVVGGVMAHAGYDLWMTNYAEWTGAADVEGGDMVRLMEAWQMTMQGGHQRVGDLRKQAVEAGLFERRFGRANSERGQDAAMGTVLRRYLRRAVSTQYGKFCIRESFLHGVRMYALERS